MKTNWENNAITQRLDILNTRFEEFRENQKAKILLWLIQYDEMPLIETFFNLENTEHGNFPDLFLRFESSFETSDQYQKALTKEFQNFLQQEQQMLTEDGMNPSFLSDPGFKKTGFLPALSVFAEAIPDLKEGSVVAWLAPDSVRDYAEWENWMISALEQGFPPQVRLMLACTETEYGFARLRTAFPEAFCTLIPKLDMPAAMRQLASTGNPKDPGTQFRVHFVKMSQAASVSKFDKMQSEGEKAIHIAQQQAGWEHLEVAVFIAMGNAMLKEDSKYTLSLNYFEKACQSGIRATQTGNPAGGVVYCQALFAKAVALLKKKQYAEAGQVYESIVPISREVKNGDFQAMEAWRMAAYCHEHDRKAQNAWDCNLAALQMAEGLDEQIRANSTLPYIGQALVRLSEALGKHRQLPQIRQQLESWVGPDWETQTNHQKTYQN